MSGRSRSQGVSRVPGLDTRFCRLLHRSIPAGPLPISRPSWTAGEGSAEGIRWAKLTCSRLVSDIPSRALRRSLRLAGLPAAHASRAALGVGKRLGGRPAELVAAEIQGRTAAQLFQTLGELKGGAMKVGQALSVMEAALPEDLASPYRDALERLQEAAPPMPAATVHQVLREEFGAGWRQRFRAFDDRPAAAASIGQVHQAMWDDGTTVAVKI